MSGAATRTRPRRTFLLPMVMAVLLLAPVGLSAQTTTGGTATLVVSSPRVVFGGWINLTGSITVTPPCAAGRVVQLQIREGGGAWTLARTSQTSTAGAYAFWWRPPHSARYRARLPATGSCGLVTSPGVTASVSVRVVVAANRPTVAAGFCGMVGVDVQPPEPHTTVLLERAASSGWSPVASLSLDSASHAVTQRCYAWGDIGTDRFRATWAHGSNTLNADGVSRPLALAVVRAPWMKRIDRLAAGHAVSIAVRAGGRLLYERADTIRRTPASNEKLLLSMALLDRLGPGFTISTSAAARTRRGGVVQGNLWILGRGDPGIVNARLKLLARRIRAAGVARITGSVMGSRTYFAHDWFAPGWKPDFPTDEVALPTALTYRGNQVRGVHVTDPERRAARALSRILRNQGVTVLGTAGMGRPPAGVAVVARIVSPALASLLRRQNVDSVNFLAEMMAKLLGVARYGTPGTIAKGAAAIQAWAHAHSAFTTNRDGSGLSYQNRITALGMVRLLQAASGSSWGSALRATLPRPGQGTLEDRLAGVPVWAKTGTLTHVSALSGWVRLDRTGQRAVFSILSGGMVTSRAKALEDAIVRVLWRSAH